MNKILTVLLTTIGLTSATHAGPPAQTIDPKDLRFSMPTVAADDIQFVMPTKETFEGAPQFHEDEWCQVEFFAQARLGEIQRLLSEFKAFEQKNRTEHGWKQIYARSVQRPVLIEGEGAVALVAQTIQAKALPAPILTTSSRPLGQVEGGFTLELPGSVSLYGLRGKTGIAALGAIVARGGDDSQLTRAFATLSRRFGLILVDWRAQQILVSANEAHISVWRP